MIIDKYLITNKDQLDVQSLLVYTNPQKCNLDCWNCHNKQDNTEYKYLSLDEFRQLTEKAKLLGCELCIISGGEPFLNNVDELRKYIEYSTLPIRIDTNGTFPEKIKQIEDTFGFNVIGFALDIKIPLYDQSRYDLDFYRQVFSLQDKSDEFIRSYIQYYTREIERTLKYILTKIKEGKLKREYCLTRTVLYAGYSYQTEVLIDLNVFYGVNFDLPRIQHYFLEFVDDNYKFTKDSNLHCIITEFGDVYYP